MRYLRDLEDKKILVPSGGKGEPRGYSLLDLQKYLQAAKPKGWGDKILGLRRKLKATQTIHGELAACIFDALDEKKSKLEIVKLLRVHPDVVDLIAMKYEKLRREKDSSIPLAPCVKCGTSPGRFCGECC